MTKHLRFALLGALLAFGLLGCATAPADKKEAKATEPEYEWVTPTGSNISRVDPRRYNGATLIGLKGIVVKSHGGADALAFRYAIKKAYAEITQRVLERIEQRLAAMPVPVTAAEAAGPADA